MIKLPFPRCMVSVLAFFLLAGCGSKDSTISVTSSKNTTVFFAHNAVVVDGAVYTWGYNGYGQLGNGTKENDATPAAVAIDGLPRIDGASAGGTHTLAFKNMSGVWAWGNNGHGQLGEKADSTEARATPVKVIDDQGAPLSNVIAVAAGTYHSLALDKDGNIWAWGANYYGQLGDGTTIQRHTAVKVIDLTGVKLIAAGGSHSLAMKDDGTVWAWGLNDVGQLGSMTTPLNYSSTPVQVKLQDGSDLIGNPDNSSIAAGIGHNLVLDADGQIWGWGNNSLGQLDQGIWNSTPQSMDPPSVKNAMRIGNITGATAVAAGLAHSLVLASDGSILGWGFNFYGQLGNGAVSKSIEPVVDPPAKVLLQGGSELKEATNIIASGKHSIGYTGKTFWTWGDNLFKQLGRATDGASSSSAVDFTIP